MKKYVTLYKKYLNKIVPFLLDIFKNISNKNTVIFSLFIIVTGQLINYLQPFENFHIYQFLFLLAIIISSWSIKYFLRGITKFNEITASHPIKFVGINFLKLLKSKWVLLGLFVIGGIYIYSTISLKYIEFNFVGFYALLMIVMVMFTAIFGQTIYIYYIILLNNLRNQNEFKYNFYTPAKTEWLVLISKKGRMLNNAFFILGFIYTLVYYLNIPNNAIVFEETNKANIFEKINIITNNNVSFIISWIVIFIIIIVAFPVYYFLQNLFIKLIIRKLKDKSINEIQLLMKTHKLTKKDDVELELKYLSLVESIENSPKKTTSNRNYIPLISSISSIGVHLIKISDSFL